MHIYRLNSFIQLFTHRGTQRAGEHNAMKVHQDRLSEALSGCSRTATARPYDIVTRTTAYRHDRTDNARSTVPHARHANKTRERKHSKCANSAHAQPAHPQKQANPKVCARGGWLLATPRPSH